MRLKICHIMFYDKFINEYIELNNNNFTDNYFLVFKTPTLEKMNLEIIEAKNVLVLNNIKTSMGMVTKYLNKFDKVFIHGLFNRTLVIFLFFNRKYLKKINWIIWGGDLYYYKYRKNSIKSNLYEYVRKYVIRNFNEITALIKGDYELAKQVYKTNAKYNYAFYPNPINFTFLDKARLMRDDNSDILTIQIGNSADPTNQHLDILNILSAYRDKNIKVICPLSYGNKDHVTKVIQYGNKIFGDKFQPLTEYLKPEEYSKIIANVDIAIFNHQRQQALGNIIGLLYLGKKVYIRSDITPWDYFDKLGVKLYNTIELKNTSFDNLINFNESIGQANRKIVSKEFSEEHCVELWNKALYGGE